MVVRLTISYDGTSFAGWQRQDNAFTVQEAVENALSDLLGKKTAVVGASRTDAGVHARAQACHFHAPEGFPLRGLVHGGNHRLPPEVRLLAAHLMPDRFHAQRCSLGKEYSYRFVIGRVISPLDRAQASQLPLPLDLAAIRRALPCLPGRHDFSAFALAGGSHSHAVRRLFAARVDETSSGLVFRFWGDGFLRGMVRSLVGTLVEVGRGRRDPDSVKTLLEVGRDRQEAGFTAEACGLCLERVFYGPRWLPLAGYNTATKGGEEPVW